MDTQSNIYFLVCLRVRLSFSFKTVCGVTFLYSRHQIEFSIFLDLAKTKKKTKKNKTEATFSDIIYAIYIHTHIRLGE